MAKKPKSPLPVQVKRFENAIKERYPDLDSKLTASTILNRVSIYIEEGYDVAVVKQLSNNNTRLIILDVEKDRDNAKKGEDKK
jgi:hypothetical protein